MTRHGRARLFPAGLYATLLGALCWLALPVLTGPIEGRVLAIAALPLQGYTAAFGVIGTPEDGGVVRELELFRDLRSRQERVALLGNPARASDRDGTGGSDGMEHEPVHCRVLARSGRGGAGAASLLILDRTYRELQGCAPWITFGESLVGFLGEPGSGPAQDHDTNDSAHVVLLSHRSSRRVPAALVDPDLGPLRFVVEPAGSVDPWPQRASFYSDPYLAAHLQHRGTQVRTTALSQTVFSEPLPPGLLLGESRLWGYDDLPIGVFVEPVPSPDRLANVVAWRRSQGAGGSGPSRESDRLRQAFEVGRALSARLLELPTPSGPRYYVDGVVGDLPDGAALVDGVRLLGRVRGFAFGTGLGEPFGLPGQEWELLAMPEGRGAPVPVRATVEIAGRDRVVLRLKRPLDGFRGHLFTGVNGRHCPAGLYLGPAAALDADPSRLAVRWVGLEARRGQGVYVQGVGGQGRPPQGAPGESR